MNCGWSCVFSLKCSHEDFEIKESWLKQKNKYAQEWTHANNWWNAETQLPLETAIPFQIFYTISSMGSTKILPKGENYQLKSITLVDTKIAHIIDVFSYNPL